VSPGDFLAAVDRLSLSGSAPQHAMGRKRVLYGSSPIDARRIVAIEIGIRIDMDALDQIALKLEYVAETPLGENAIRKSPPGTGHTFFLPLHHNIFSVRYNVETCHVVFDLPNFGGEALSEHPYLSFAASDTELRKIDCRIIGKERGQARGAAVNTLKVFDDRLDATYL
jgi:hypothetical protein